ncbi:hypothetical protein A3D78_00360 [Candidatus Gottesmanbacteria bacterium RIFCSPHIGHO2_02_FULL_39_14]|uniref:Aspartyl/glutamyl-tRNA(Asn/Gln) amidotransferase subunit C n=3 Tax=Candidatus Gottesmaniibacteriota TaxID=1752720 RepID=A0A1F5ZTX6_9BACT|nr:MAG: hypothetical protein A2153_03240 [Candidatus Gottesmanbacteria bacterium RBG_16_38_7b]OGG15936.1 MAG: hypothetical protein A3D78_00360 [Candidatus Gottesmanbacteria bacterium RIFCSPHIGHO2_02_FULL_39_14]OGG31075.1 MAG: hypothetical protein A3I51_04120 [Candidatus Gottesmanbacteria bacterium RIFCSPLOWO2_02_FULL_38_8]
MKNQKAITKDQVKHLAKLANLKLTDKELEKLLPQFTSVVDFVSKVQSLNTKNIPETSQVTGLENIFREDLIDKNRMFTQDEALSNAKKTYKGYFEVDAIFEE